MLTEKQQEWDAYKSAQRAERYQSRGIRLRPTRRRLVKCDCPHTAKHHSKRGRCRKGCPCTAGANR